ncbi:hypothetical protein GCM10010401_22830 [Rarobacter faecitabidus]|uniref:Tetratricopeptide repeat protein n=1 Tax=Rarobacter faecitabidus TaxID=13243 RepID=A0A542ZW37_RARFA|nr:hypothetical protein [Rarobacter faecitabidus]TQL64575.1 hypothetical protein FB461_1081 [Rarobacter faecitabidus]
MSMLDREARERLRGLTKENAQFVGAHLVAAGSVIDDDPELAYKHAQAAVSRGGRVDVVREALGIAAYRTERYAEAIRELRTFQRISGSPEHLPIIADSERGRGNPRRAVDLWQSPDAAKLAPADYIELGIVVAGARADLEEYDAALQVLQDFSEATKLPADIRLRILEARVEILRRAGRDEQADSLESKLPQPKTQPSDDNIVVFEVDEEADEAGETGGAAAPSGDIESAFAHEADASDDGFAGEAGDSDDEFAHEADASGSARDAALENDQVGREPASEAPVTNAPREEQPPAHASSSIGIADMSTTDSVNEATTGGQDSDE